MTVSARILVAAALAIAIPRHGMAQTDLIVTLTQPGQTKPFKVFRCVDTETCIGDATFERNGLKLPLHLAMEALPSSLRFTMIDCRATGWNFWLLPDGGGSSFPPGQTRGTLWLNDENLRIEPVLRDPPGLAVMPIIVGLSGADRMK